MESRSEETHEKLIRFLSDAESYSHGTSNISHCETHISHIFLTGQYAYKIKKPRKLDFLDFSTLEKRKFYVKRELELNRKYAPGIYLSVVPIYKEGKRYTFSHSGEPVEYALKMKQFRSEDLFDRMVNEGRLNEAHLVGLVKKIVKFHLEADCRSEYWGVEQVENVLETNFSVCREFIPKLLSQELLKEVEALSNKELEQHRSLISKRQSSHVKELHGDLHLGNICLFEGEPTPFDRIEFNEKYSTCDTWADIAFLLMDLHHEKRVDLANLVLNLYLEQTDDFEGLLLLPLYLSYRAAVRAKVNCLSWQRGEEENRKQIKLQVESYLDLAKTALEKNERCIVAVGGLSGSGKSTVAAILAKTRNAVVVRSDAVRKHLVNISLDSSAPKEAYSSECSNAVYQGLLQRGQLGLDAGYTVILDATFLEESERGRVESWAKVQRASFSGFWCEVSDDVAKKRLKARMGDVSDADFEIYLTQKKKEIGQVSWERVNTEIEKDQLELEFGSRKIS